MLPWGVPTERGARPAASSAAPDRRAAVDERRQRAIEEALDVRVRSTDPYLQLEVRNPVHRTGYRVLMPTYPASDLALCTCTDFARRGLGTCKHIEAARRWLKGHPGRRTVGDRRPRPSLAPVWSRIDRAQKGRSKDPAPESLAWRRPGNVLFLPSSR